MFEEQLYKHIKNNFTVSGFSLSFGFGEIEEDTQAPYIIQYSLDADGTHQALCKKNDFTEGEAFIQWNIYSPNSSNGFYIKQQLMTFLADLRSIDNYQIAINRHEASPSNLGQNNGLAIDVVARTFTYNKKGD